MLPTHSPATCLPLFASHYRLAGLKRYFHSKRGEGLLSAQGLRILDYACDCAINCPHQPLVRAPGIHQKLLMGALARGNGGA